jgi:hypothetical protein
MLALAMVVVLHAGPFDTRAPEPVQAAAVEWPVWPAIVSAAVAVPAALGGLVAFTQLKLCPGCTTDPVMFWTAAEGLGLGAILLLGGIVFGAIVQHHNAGPSPDAQE